MISGKCLLKYRQHLPPSLRPVVVGSFTIVLSCTLMVRIEQYLVLVYYFEYVLTCSNKSKINEQLTLSQIMEFFH